MTTYIFRFHGDGTPDRSVPGPLKRLPATAKELSRLHDCVVSVVRPDGTEAFRADYWASMKKALRRHGL